MATLADELLNDFEDSGSENGDRENGFLDNGEREPNDHLFKEISNGQIGMELDGDEEGDEDADEEIAARQGAAGIDEAPDEEETKAKVEKMKLAGVSDVRTVAGLMKTLQPVLEVRCPFPCLWIFRNLSLHLPQSRSNFRSSHAENRPLSIQIF